MSFTPSKLHEQIQQFLMRQSIIERVREQQKARQLLFANLPKAGATSAIKPSPAPQSLSKRLSPASEIILPDEVQNTVYTADTGTSIIPPLIKRMLLNNKLSFVVRPGAIEDVLQFTQWATQKKQRFTIRGSGTWPFGGSVPLNGDIVLDLSYLNFKKIFPEDGLLAVASGVTFADAKKFLKKEQWALRQEITNPGSGTITGWIATGGFGLGSYKYGHVRQSIELLMVITPDGNLLTLTADDPRFEMLIGSEGQLGVIVGAALKIRKESFVDKPFAFALESSEEVQRFLETVRQSNIRPTSVIYYDYSYIKQTYAIETEHYERKTAEALKNNDQTRLGEMRQDFKMLEELKSAKHIVVMQFDENSDYQQAIKTRIFGESGATHRVNGLKIRQLSTALSHKLWEHRFLPVQMKQKGPSMLVSENILPLEAFNRYQHMLRQFLRRLLNVDLKSEAHLLPDGHMLIQSIVLADTRTLRHKIYFALVPLMNEVAMLFGAQPYGVGIWNLPLIKYFRRPEQAYIKNLKQLKSELDPAGILNRGKFIHNRGHRWTFRLFNRLSPVFNRWLVKTTYKRQQGKKFDLSYPFERAVWNASGYLFPKMIPPALKAHKSDPIEELIAPCAECDSCEHVCPTSDVFGMYGYATPITRRKSAQRLASGEEISQQEALGFLVCTRCDNCTNVCPTDIPLTNLFDLVEEDNRFQNALHLKEEEKRDFIDRFWQIMKDSPLYKEHTLSEQNEVQSHLQHGLKILYPKGFEYGQLFIDEETCIHCGMCSNENACMYGAREGRPRQIPELLDLNCALCNACVNYCPQNKIAQEERLHLDKLIINATDLDEKKYWINRQTRVHDTTTVHRSNQLTEMADRYVTENIIMEIDKESSSGQIPVSGMGQGDRHMGIGFDAERFSHFHIVGPAQNRLHEGDPEEELSIILGKRENYCKFDDRGKLVNPIHPTLKLMTPILYNTVPLQSNGRLELAFIRVAERQKSLVAIELERLLEYYNYFITEGNYDRLPAVIMPRVDHELIHRIIVNPHTNRDFLSDLWRMPVFEVEYHPQIERTLNYIYESAKAVQEQPPLISGYMEISEYDLIGSLTPTADIKEKVTHLLNQGIDILHIHGLRNKEEYFVTSTAVRALHHYLMRIGRRHEVSVIASGGIRLASDSQKTIQRGAEGTMIDFAALLALDPSAYRAITENKATTEKLLSLDVDQAVERLNNQAESRKVQILEVLGASGFKDIKKTVGEEGRLIDFHQIEDRLQRDIFNHDELITQYAQLNRQNIASEEIPHKYVRPYSFLKSKIINNGQPHNFYRLGETNQTLYKSDFVWPGNLIEAMGRMAAGDQEMLNLKEVKATGLLGDGFDVMKILYNKDPMDIKESELDKVQTALPLDKGLILEAPWMFGGKSVGSIGLDTWKAHVTAARELGIQYDTGEGGYPTSFFLNSKGEPIFFTENEIRLLKPLFENDHDYTVAEMRAILQENGMTPQTHPEVYEKIKHFPSSKPFHFLVVVDEDQQPFVSTEMKTGLFGVSKETIRKARRVVIAYSQGAKMGIGGHILAQKVNKLVSYLRGIEGLEKLDEEKLEGFYELLKKYSLKSDHVLKDVASEGLQVLDKTQELQAVSEDLKTHLLHIQEAVYALHEQNAIDDITFQRIIRYAESIIVHSYTSIISPFPFHNSYSIEDVKSFIDIVHMINPQASIAIKVSPSIDIEFIAAGLARISKDNTTEIVNARFGLTEEKDYTDELKAYAKAHGMTLEIWLDGPRGGTGASPNIIKGQMGMHIEYAIPLIHYRLVQDGLRNHVKFIVSGGIRTYEDVIKAVALGADGVIWGTAPLVAIGCDRNRNCHDGCSRGIATSNLTMQKLRDIDKNTLQIINAFTIMQMQVIRALAALGFNDIRELRGRFDKIHWLGLKERVDHRFRVNEEIKKEIARDEQLFMERIQHQTGQTNCGVAAVNGTMPIPGIVLDEGLNAMRNRGMDGVGIAKTLCFPEHAEEYAYRILIKGYRQLDIEENLKLQWQAEGKDFSEAELRREARQLTIYLRNELMKKIKVVFLDTDFDYFGVSDVAQSREPYKSDADGNELDYRQFGGPESDPGDIYRFFVRVKTQALENYIRNHLFKYDWNRFFAHQFPGVTPENYQDNARFLSRAEDVFVFHHGTNLTRILYVSEAEESSLLDFRRQSAENISAASTLPQEEEGISEEALRELRAFIEAFPFAHNKQRYKERANKLAAVMSNGKNMATWKTAGREIPWKTPDAPNNIIHVRLATGSVVEQMNAHPFTKLHTALTHNGETTNYEALKQRVEQFDLSPLATTDTEVAALKFHLTAEEWSYPDWALFESFSPTTGDDLQLVQPELRPQLEQVQRVEFTSSPDGPYQYLCLRHNPEKRVTERVDLKDPADLRPNVTAFWHDEQNGKKRIFSMIASEEQALHTMLRKMDDLGIIEGAAADQTLSSSGMISRYAFDERNKIYDVEFIDRYGTPIELTPVGQHYSVRRNAVQPPKDSSRFNGWQENYRIFFTKELAKISFADFHWLLDELVKQSSDNDSFAAALQILTWLRDYLRTLDPGKKAQSSLIDMADFYIEKLLGRAAEDVFSAYCHTSRQQGAGFNAAPQSGQTLVIDAGDFIPEGSDPDVCLASFLNRAYELGWRSFILYRTRGQRLISTAVMGASDTDDVVVDVYGSAGEYFGAFMQGGTLRLHGNAQNFCAMGMHHGNLYVYGNAGKVNGYASKGGKVVILGNIIDRAWTNSVNDSRCQDLEVFILGSATKYAGESLMGGNFFFGGLHFDQTGKLRFNERPYLGTKMLGGASRGKFVFFDPEDRLIEAQYAHGKLREFTGEEWKYYLAKIKEVFELANIPIYRKNGQEYIHVEERMVVLAPASFKLIVPKGGLKGYESH